MNGKTDMWLAVAVAALLGLAVGMALNGRQAVGAAPAGANVATSPGVAGHITALAGWVSAQEQPIYLIDSREEVLLVYEYGLGQNGIRLIAARSFKYDKLLPEFDIRANHNESPSVQDVRKSVRRKKRR